MVVLGVPGLEVRLVGEVSVRMIMSVNDIWSECLCDIDAAESLAIVYGRRRVRSSVRSFAYNRHVGDIDCFAVELCNCGYVNMWIKRCVRNLS